MQPGSPSFSSRLPPVTLSKSPSVTFSPFWTTVTWPFSVRSEEHTSELQSLAYLVCRLLLEKKKKTHEANAAPGLRPLPPNHTGPYWSQLRLPPGRGPACRTGSQDAALTARVHVVAHRLAPL